MLPQLPFRGCYYVLNKKIIRYLMKRNKELEQEVLLYKKDAKQVSHLLEELSSLRDEWQNKLYTLKQMQSEYSGLIKDTKLVRASLEDGVKRMEGSK